MYAEARVDCLSREDLATATTEGSYSGNATSALHVPNFGAALFPEKKRARALGKVNGEDYSGSMEDFIEEQGIYCMSGERWSEINLRMEVVKAD